MNKLNTQVDGFSINTKSIYHFDDFRFLHDTEFVQAAYRAVLGRDPDEGGLDYYTNRLRAGQPKCLVLNQIVQSQEGRSSGVKVVGLAPKVYEQKLFNMPIIGGILAVLVFSFTVRSHLQELRALENYIVRLSKSHSDK